MSRISKFEYIEIEDNLDFKFLRLKDIKGFLKMLTELNIKFVFKTSTKISEEKNSSDFVFIHNQFFYRIDSKNYNNLEDYEDGIKTEFPDAASFYDSRSAGISTYKEYMDCKKTGVVDKTLYTKAQKLGFFDSFEKFKEKCEKNSKLIPVDFVLANYESPIKLSEYATSKGFKDYADFDKAFFLGFPDRFSYDDAKSKDFTYAEDYFNAIRMGFDHIKEYQEAKFLKIQSKHEYNQYITIKKLAKGIFSFDQVAMMLAIKNCDNGKKLSLKKIKELILQKEDEYKFVKTQEGIKELPEWWTKKLNTEDDIEKFLLQDTVMKNYGIYDTNGDYFEVWRISNQKIFLDASNVAYASRDGKTNKPKFLHIKQVAEELKRMRFTEIIVIADAALKHRIEDAGLLNELKKIVTYLEAPAGTTADEFLIANAKKDKCCIISNDTFRDWKMKDSWIVENIDKIRVPFLIEGEKVTLSGIEKFIRIE